MALIQVQILDRNPCQQGLLVCPYLRVQSPLLPDPGVWELIYKPITGPGVMGREAGLFKGVPTPLGVVKRDAPVWRHKLTATRALFYLVIMDFRFNKFFREVDTLKKGAADVTM